MSGAGKIQRHRNPAIGNRRGLKTYVCRTGKVNQKSEGIDKVHKEEIIRQLKLIIKEIELQEKRLWQDKKTVHWGLKYRKQILTEVIEFLT